MLKEAVVTKTTDSKGRINLGQAFANLMVIIEHRGDEVVLRPARAIPEREAWLYENKQALTQVRAGLAQAREGDLVQGPDLSAAARLARRTRGK